jgi:chromatin assembly factor 1 subunit B
LLITSSDGFCSTLTFSPGELGQVYSGEFPTPKHPTLSASSSGTPAPTPTSVIAPPSPFPHSHTRTSSASATSAASPSPHIHHPQPMHAGFVSSGRPSSPTRSNSTSSVATQASYATPAPGSNPSLITGNVPSITATGSSMSSVMPLTTPPQTPHSATSSVSGVAGIKRETLASSESEKDEKREEGVKKKRRIAPTLVSER